jgi:hypothetical protein
VTDLKREDFALLDQGHPEQISAFSIESLHTLPALPSRFPRTSIRTGWSKGWARRPASR